MLSHNFRALLAKEWRELFASRAFWILLLMIGPLVGHGFITAVNLYAEVSGIGGGPSALAQGLTPLDGIFVPTFGAYDLAVTFLFPFVAIRSIAAEKESGGVKLLLQLPGSLGAKIAAKALALLGGWLLAWSAGLLAVVLWGIYGGHVYAPETANLFLGHLLRATLSCGVAVAAAALAESAASAAIVTLGLTVGTWVLDFIAAGRGGLLQQLAAYTPTAALRSFEQGLLSLSAVVVMLAASLAGFALAAIWLETGRKLQSRAFRSGLALVGLAVVGVMAAGFLRADWDTSENRRNSFPRADEAALGQIREPLQLTVFLSPEDPRLTDLEQNVLGKLRRILPRVDVDYSAASRSGLFESNEDHYGEIWYEMSGRRVMERSTIEPVVLAQIYKLAGVQPPPAGEDELNGYPLAARPVGAPLIFYGLWPLATILFWWLTRR